MFTSITIISISFTMIIFLEFEEKNPPSKPYYIKLFSILFKYRINLLIRMYQLTNSFHLGIVKCIQSTLFNKKYKPSKPINSEHFIPDLII